MADVSGGRSTPTPDAKCGRCGHFWDWHGKRDNDACKGGYPVGMSVSPCACTARPPVGDTTDLEQLLPWTVIEDVNGDIWQKRERRYGSSWYQPGDGQPHGTWDIAQPVTVISEPECSCAMTESSMTSCPLHGYDAPEDGPTQPQPLNQGLDDADVRAAQAAFPCPHPDPDDDGYCITCDRRVTTQPQPTDVQLEPRTDFAVDVAERIIERLQGAVAEIRALHRQYRNGDCVQCGPKHGRQHCPTIRALNDAGCL